VEGGGVGGGGGADKLGGLEFFSKSGNGSIEITFMVSRG